MKLEGIHHITAITGDAQRNVDFYVGVLGLRLVKKTVNFDNHHVYHFYYGDAAGTPGTLWTTFPYKGRGVPVGRKGAGQVTVTSFSVPNGSLDTWRTRLGAHASAVTDLAARFGDPVIRFADRSGITFELIATGHDPRTPWLARDFEAADAIRGLHSVTLVVRDSKKTVELMTQLLDYTVVGEMDSRIRLAVNGGGPGKIVDVAQHPEADAASNGLGTVHHVAMAIGSAAEQLALREELLRHGCKVTEVRDRCYFQSIYFREPGGVLFEVATMAPGFTADEPLDALGRALKLPPWEEPHRSEIEARLPPLVAGSVAR